MIPQSSKLLAMCLIAYQKVHESRSINASRGHAMESTQVVDGESVHQLFQACSTSDNMLDVQRSRPTAYDSVVRIKKDFPEKVLGAFAVSSLIRSKPGHGCTA